MALEREKQRIASNEVLQALALGEDINLEHCCISGHLDLNRLFDKTEQFDISALNVTQKENKTIITFAQKIRFYGCTFEENVYFASPWSQQDTLDVVFKRDVVFNSSIFNGQTRFSGALFQGTAGFDGCKFNGVASFAQVQFKAPAMFRTAEFNGYALFTEAVFSRDSRFVNTLFEKGGNFTKVVFDAAVDFTGAHSSSKALPIYESVRFTRKSYGEDESFWRFVKQAAQEAGYYRQAGEAFYSERCACFYKRFRGKNYDDLSLGQKTVRWLYGSRLLPELFFGKFLFGYGERPVRVLVVCLLVIVVCAGLYSRFGQLVARDGTVIPSHNMTDILYYSTITFTTLGYGDITPCPTSDFTKYLAMIEAICGASLTALFVVGLAKRFSRS